MGHNLIKNLERYIKKSNLSDKECEDLKEMCRKYVNHGAATRIKDVHGKVLYHYLTARINFSIIQKEMIRRTKQFMIRTGTLLIIHS